MPVLQHTARLQTYFHRRKCTKSRFCRLSLTWKEFCSWKKHSVKGCRGWLSLDHHQTWKHTREAVAVAREWPDSPGHPRSCNSSTESAIPTRYRHCCCWCNCWHRVSTGTDYLSLKWKAYCRKSWAWFCPTWTTASL